jgi:hypothetical protein
LLIALGPSELASCSPGVHPIDAHEHAGIEYDLSCLLAVV